ncbi:MAG: 4-alpha-glucanotransferase [Deltaproteobacteria bacterium]|nr:4-alpha-glucanotransferase [Deltaproteobacteria bacterium]
MATAATSSEDRPLRSAGVLLHPTSLPSPHGIGDLGEGARRFVDWLADAGVTRWQVLPLVPAGPGNAPYATPAALAGHPLLVDLHGLAADGLLAADDLRGPSPDFALDTVDFERVVPFKRERLERAAAALLAGRNPDLLRAYEAFRASQRWAEEAATFLVMRAARDGRPWWDWEPALRDREAGALAAEKERLAAPIAREVALFFFFERQWAALREYTHAHGIKIIGDIPIYVDRDSVDVWSARDQFRLNPDGSPIAVAGVPPDFFSKTGQLWGNPLYDWERMAADGHRWWIARLGRALAQVDIVRLDHFRGFANFWEVDPAAEDARGGRWVDGPGHRLFDDLRRALGDDLPLIAEDLGEIDDAVHALRDRYDLPGMKVLQFAFGGGNNHPFLPHRHTQRSVCYTATHDNDTTLGWWQSTDERARDHARRYLAVNGHDIVWDLVRAAFASVAELAVVPLQDVLCLDGRTRMNVPGVAEGNWRWRVRVQAFNHPLALRVREIATLYGRARPSS